MKSKTVQFQIPEPCHQNLDQAPMLPGGRYCQNCEKTIVDFTEMTDMELVRHYQKHKGRICGTFLPEQLNRPMPLPTPPSKYRHLKNIGALLSGLMFFNVGQTQPLSLSPPAQLALSQSIEEEKATISKPTVLSGKVMDSSGEALMFANIACYINGGLSHGTQSDMEGNFQMEVPADTKFSLTFTHIGHVSKTLSYDQIMNTDSPVLNVKLLLGVKLPEIVVVAPQKGTMQQVTVGLVVGLKQHNEPREIEEKEKTPVIEEVAIGGVFPNPFISTLHLEMNLLKNETVLFHLYNVNGQLVFAESRALLQGKQLVQLEMGSRNLIDGTYFLRISDSIGEIRTKQVVRMAGE